MFCLICRKHNTINLQNKAYKFNSEASVRFKRTAIVDHRNSQQHKYALQAELVRRMSTFHKQVEQRDP